VRITSKIKHSIEKLKAAKYSKSTLLAVGLIIGISVGSQVLGISVGSVLSLVDSQLGALSSGVVSIVFYFVVLHQLIHRFKTVDPFVLMKAVFILGCIGALIAAAAVITSGAVGIQQKLGTLVGLLLLPLIAVAPIYLILGDKPPPADYP